LTLIYNRNIFLLLQFCLWSTIVLAQKTSLIAVEYDGNAAATQMQHITKYTFENGVMQKKETIMTVPARKNGKDYARFDLGNSTIYKNRYVVTSIGTVIDTKTKNVLSTDNATFVKQTNDSVVFYTNDIFKGKYYAVLNTEKGTYTKVENANYNPRPRPDVEVDETIKPFTITAYYINGKKDMLVKDAGFGEAQPLLGEDVKRRFPIFWINNTSFLYANFPKNQQMASIYKVSLNKAIEKIADITEIPATAENTSFVFAKDGSIIYTCGKGKFLIDVAKKKAEKIIAENIGDGFLVDADDNPKFGKTVKYESVEIGKKWCRTDNAKTIKNYVALQNDIVIGTERYTQGVIVWNTFTKKWLLLDTPSLVNIVGWIEE
jgi:hypothetical protein